MVAVILSLILAALQLVIAGRKLNIIYQNCPTLERYNVGDAFLQFSGRISLMMHLSDWLMMMMMMMML